MRIASGLIMLPLFCLIVIILTGVLIWIVVKRGGRTVQDYLESQESQDKQRSGSPDLGENAAANTNTRWARGDLRSQTAARPTPTPVTICGACGAENPAGESKCQSCGQPL